VDVNVRVVAATNQDLEELVRSGRFRNDLYHRLAEFKLEIPPLRERPEDLLAIAEQILHQHHPSSRFSNDGISALLTYEWPGNVRELRNSVFSRGHAGQERPCADHRKRFEVEPGRAAEHRQSATEP